MQLKIRLKIVKEQEILIELIIAWAFPSGPGSPLNLLWEDILNNTRSFRSPQKDTAAIPNAPSGKLYVRFSKEKNKNRKNKKTIKPYISNIANGINH